MKTRVVVCGGTDFNDRTLCFETLSELLSEKREIEIISGHARGADALGEEYAHEHSIELTLFPADWSRYGRAAGPIRNSQMIEYAQEANALVVAFWNGKSPGTKNTIDLAKRSGIEIYVIRY